MFLLSSQAPTMAAVSQMLWRVAMWKATDYKSTRVDRTGYSGPSSSEMNDCQPAGSAGGSSVLHKGHGIPAPLQSQVSGRVGCSSQTHRASRHSGQAMRPVGRMSTSRHVSRLIRLSGTERP